jgi:hypothetical protein
MNGIRKEDLVDLDIIDASELASDGYSVYLTTTLVSTTNAGSLVTINLPQDGEGLITGKDHPLSPGDRVWITGTSGGLADGYYICNNVISDTSFSVTSPILSSTGGTIYFMHPAGAFNVGFDLSNYTAIHVTHKNVQEAIQDLDLAISGSGGGITASQHETLRQLIHLADGVGGPFEGFATNAYREVLPINSAFPTSIIWWKNAAKTHKYVEKTITFNTNKTPALIEWKVYGTDGFTVLATVTDTITYSGPFELYRVRGIIDNTIDFSNLTIESHKYVRQLIHLADGVGGPFEGFTSGAYREILPMASPFPTSIIWYDNNTKTKKIVEKTIVYNTNKTVSLITWKVYDIDGITVLATVSDNMTYSGIFENNRTRSIS